MRTANGPRHFAALLLASALPALLSSAQAATPTEPQSGHSAATAATALQAAKQAVPAAAQSARQSATGQWVGAPCQLVVSKDDGKNVEADCFTPQGLHHPFTGTYTSPDMIEGTVTRTDPSGCQVPVPMSIHITDVNHAEYTHPGFTGCGVNNAGPAVNYPIRRAQLVSTTSASTAPSGAQQQASRASSTTASKTATAKTEGQETKTPGALRTAEGESKMPGTIKTAAAPVAKPKPVKPAIKVPVELPLKSSN